MEFTLHPSPKRQAQEQISMPLSRSGHLRAGQTAYNTGQGYWLGVENGVAKFSLGDPAGSFITWNGVVLTLSGAPLVREILAAPAEVTIPENFQMVLADNFEIEDGASLIIEGRLAIL